jgi:hypothetical protein
MDPYMFLIDTELSRCFLWPPNWFWWRDGDNLRGFYCGGYVHLKNWLFGKLTKNLWNIDRAKPSKFELIKDYMLHSTVSALNLLTDYWKAGPWMINYQIASTPRYQPTIYDFWYHFDYGIRPENLENDFISIFWIRHKMQSSVPTSNPNPIARPLVSSLLGSRSNTAKSGHRQSDTCWLPPLCPLRSLSPGKE